MKLHLLNRPYSQYLVLCALLLLLGAGAASAATDWVIPSPANPATTQTYTAPTPLPYPPGFDGDIIVRSGATLNLINYTGVNAQALPSNGNIVVENGGTLTLNNCDFAFAPVAPGDTGLRIAGDITATDTTFEGPISRPFLVQATGNAVCNYTRCTFNALQGMFTDDSVNTLDHCCFFGSSYSGSALTFTGNSVSSLTNCTAAPDTPTPGMHFEGHSVSTVTNCTFTNPNCDAHGMGHGATVTLTNCTFDLFNVDTPPVDWAPLTLTVDGGKLGCLAFGHGQPYLLQLDQLNPGTQQGTITSPPGQTPAYLSISFANNPEVDSFYVLNVNYIGAPFTANGCTLAGLHVYGPPSPPTVPPMDVNFNNSQVFDLRISDWGCPITVSGFNDSISTPQTVSISNGDFHFNFNNSSFVSDALGLRLEIAGAASWGSVVENSPSIGCIVSFDDADVTVTDSTVTGYCGPLGQDDTDTASMTLDNSATQDFFLWGALTTATLRNSAQVQRTLGFGGWSASPNICSSRLALDHARFTGSGQVIVHDNVQGAYISGSVQVDPGWTIGDWASPASTITRCFGVHVKDAGGADQVCVPVVILDASGRPVSPVVLTDCYGHACLEFTFDQQNCRSQYVVRAAPGIGSASAPLSLLSSTCIELTLGSPLMSATSFETSRYPWAAFVSGTGTARVRRLSGGTPNPPALSGSHLMGLEVSGTALAGLRLDVPVIPTGAASVSLKTHVYVGSSGRLPLMFVGFQTDGAYPDPATGWGDMLGLEVISSTDSCLRLGHSSTPVTPFSTPSSLKPAWWHEVTVEYNLGVSPNHVTVYLDGALLDEGDVSSQAPAPTRVQAVLGTASAVYFDDTSVTVPKPAFQTPRYYALLHGPEEVAPGDTVPYTLYYGNGYPGFGVFPQYSVPGMLLPLQLDLPTALGQPMSWQQNPLPAILTEGSVPFSLTMPTTQMEDNMLVRAAVPPSSTFGGPTDVQRVLITSTIAPSVSVLKEGPPTASPGEEVWYQITATNSGTGTAYQARISDNLPAELGGQSFTSNAVNLPPGASAKLVVHGTAQFGSSIVDVYNQATVNYYTLPGSGAASANSNNLKTTLQPAHDPNQITVSPTGVVDRGDTLTYTLECENTGLGTAYGVYATAQLDPQLDDLTLSIPPELTYDPLSRTLDWEVGTLGSRSSDSAMFTVNVSVAAKRARPISEQATVYFPSALETTPTNLVVNYVKGSFPDVAWDYWAALEIEQAHEADIVNGYDDSTYRPGLAVTRDAMAVFISRAMAGGESHVPTGPATATFSDVPIGYWAYNHVEYAKSHGVVGGYSDGTYRPADAVTRDQMAVFVARAMVGGESHVPTGPATATFTDVPTDHWAFKHVEYTVARGVVSGYPDGLYHPEVGVTRDQMAVFVARAFALPM